MDTQTQIERLIELAIVQRTELKELVAQLPQLREHLSTEIEKAFGEAEPQLRAELEEWTTKQAADKTAALGVTLEAKIADLAKSLEVSTQARYNAIIAEREQNARLAAEAEAKIAEHAASLPSAVKDIVTAELARFPRAGEIDQLRKEFAEPRGLNPRGKWQAGESYNKLDLVTINGDSYTSNTDGNRTRPSRSSADWTLVAARGTGGGGGPTSLSELTTVPSDGDLLIGSGTSWVTSNLTAGAGISITVGPGAITISATDGDITLDDGTAASPSLHFTNDPDTGIYRPAANTLGISVSGTQIAYFDENGLTVPSAGVVAGGSFHGANGNANNPSFSFTSDQDTGFFRHAANEIGIALGGTRYATLTSTTFSITPVVTMASSLTVNSTTDSSSKDTGAIVTEGGLGVEKSASIGGNLTVSGTGTSSFQSTTPPTVQIANTTSGLADTQTAANNVVLGTLKFGHPSDAQSDKFPSIVGRFDPTDASFARATQLEFYTSSSAGNALAMTLNKSGAATLTGNLTVSGTGNSSIAGNLLFNTSTARGILTINKTASDTLSTANAAAFIGQPDNLEAGLLMQQTASTPYSFVLQGRSPSGTYQFPISLNPQGGNVLIGTTTDGGQKLQVSGTAYVSGNTTFGGNLTATAANKTLTIDNITNYGQNLVVNAAGSLSLILQNNGAATLTLDSSQKATFAGTIALTGSSAGQVATWNSSNANGIYHTYLTNGTAIGDIGSAAQAVSGSASDFGITSRAGKLVLGTSSAARVTIDTSGNLIAAVTGTAPTLGTNSTMTFELTSNTSLTIKVRGTDGTTRSVALTLA